MGFLASPVAITVPATSANLGSGFDSFGVALELRDTVTAQVTGDKVHVSVTGEGADELPPDERHLIAEVMLRTFEQLGDQPSGLVLKCANSIPQARGMGSSSAAIVAGILLARRLVKGGGDRLSDSEVLQLAAEREGHPDNVAPCLLGGFALAWTGSAAPANAGTKAERLTDAKGVLPVIFVPVQRGYTAQARAVLPNVVPYVDAAFNLSRAALLVRALTGWPEHLFEATDDRLHQQYRAAAMPETNNLVADLRDRGIAAMVSGAGPSVLALVPDEPGRVGEAQRRCPDGWYARSYAVATEGARFLRLPALT